MSSSTTQAPEPSSTRPVNPSQLSPSLPGLTRHITTHDAQSGQSTLHSSEPLTWNPLLNDIMAFSVIYTTSQFPPVLTDDADLKSHESLMQSRGLGLVNPGGTVCRIVDFAPGGDPLMHRTQSLDFGVILEGEMEMALDDSSKDSEEEKKKPVVMRRGDVAVQRGTNHAWRNVTPNNGWARMLFVLQECEKIKLAGGEELTEDISQATNREGLASGEKEAPQ